MGSMSSGGSLDHLRFEVEVAAAHAARRPALRAAQIRLEARRAALAEAERAAEGRFPGAWSCVHCGTTDHPDCMHPDN